MPQKSTHDTRRPSDDAGPPDTGKDIPPEAGKRARVDPDGDVHGSGSDAGGGNPGEGYGDGTAGE